MVADDLQMTDGQTRRSENFVTNRNVQIVFACTALAAGIFIIDIASLPLGVAAGVAYVAVVLIALWLPGWKSPFIAAAGVSTLTILGFLLSEPAGIPWMVVANRLLTLIAIWSTAIFGSWLVFAARKHSEEALRHAEQEAERRREQGVLFGSGLVGGGGLTGVLLAVWVGVRGGGRITGFPLDIPHALAEALSLAAIVALVGIMAWVATRRQSD